MLMTGIKKRKTRNKSVLLLFFVLETKSSVGITDICMFRSRIDRRRVFLFWFSWRSHKRKNYKRENLAMHMSLLTNTHFNH